VRRGARRAGWYERRSVCACVGRHSDDSKRDQPIQHRQLRRFGIHRDARHRRGATERQRDFVAPGIARLDVRTLVIFVLMHDSVIVVMSGETVLMFRMIVPDVRVRVQARRLASRGQQGHSHEQREHTVHALSVYGTALSR
jgi:hypothetical protein